MKTKTIARGLVRGVVQRLQTVGESTSVHKAQTLLQAVTETAKRQNLARIESPVMLTEPEKQMLSRVLARVVGHDVKLECEVNAALIAGVRIQMADWIVDTSFENQLMEMSQLLTEGSTV